jgi:hypothetical protein
MTNLAQITWADIVTSVAEVHAKENAKPNRSLYLSLGNEFLAIVAEQTECYHKAWTNVAETGELTVTANYCTLPIDLIRMTRVEWDTADNPLEFRTEAWMNENLPGWQEETGDSPAYYTVIGNTMYFDVDPTSTVTGMLTVRGAAYLPALSDSGVATNPLACISVGLQRNIADYILANLPFDPGIPVENMRQARYAAKIQPVLDRLYSQVNTRQMERFGY